MAISLLEQLCFCLCFFQLLGFYCLCLVISVHKASAFISSLNIIEYKYLNGNLLSLVIWSWFVRTVDS